jgi:dUTP pyrophosphatase
MQEIDVNVKILDKRIEDDDFEDFKLPTYATDGSAGVDLRAMLDEKLIIYPSQTKIIKSGIAIQHDSNNVMAVLAPRSGLGIKKGIILAITIGVIDHDYFQEVMIAVYNRSQDWFEINPGDRICQMIFVPVVRANFKIVSDLNETDRKGGLGHTGVK